MSQKIISINDLNFREEPGDPFVVRMYHLDYYPKGNEDMEIPESDLKGKKLGNDFDLDDDWRLYHGNRVPGFPVHPHRGFETVTIVLEGYVDHYDSHGASGRYGPGDVQWMTAGSGMQHAEMFPLLHTDKENTLELFQVWLNLPAKDKFVDPYYKMLWAEDIPAVVEENEKGNKTIINLITGSYKGTKSLDPNPNSWANDEDNHMGIWTIKLEPGASLILPRVSDTLNRNLYYYRGENITIDDTNIKAKTSIKLAGNTEIKITNGKRDSYLLLLEGEPINEPMINYGPFVMNTMDEIKKAYADYNNTQFGGWPWDRRDPVNPKNTTRFAKYEDGRIEKK